MSEHSERQFARYLALCHAMQSGVAMKANFDGSETTPKHLRVGVNSAMVENSALVTLLIRKGLMTEEEWADALVEGMEREVRLYEETLKQRFGREISLA